MENASVAHGINVMLRVGGIQSTTWVEIYRLCLAAFEWKIAGCYDTKVIYG